MKNIKIIHCADIHFDTPFKDVNEKQSKINKEELKEVFNSIIDLCKKKQVDVFLLAGDIFDNLTIDKETLRFLEKSFNNIRDTRVFISPGNHDPYMINSFYKLIKWPENVYIFSKELECVYIEELNLNIWGAAFNDRYVYESMIKGCSHKSSGETNIMVIHGELNNGTGNEYNPITIEEIEKSGMDYVALGHRHNYSGIKRKGRTYYAYSGCPQGRGFDEMGEKGVIYAEISSDFSDFEFIKTSKRQYKEVNIDVSDLETHQELITHIKDMIKKEDREKNFYKVILSGELSDEFSINEKVIEDYLQNDFYFIKVIDKTKVRINFEEIVKGHSVRGIFVKKLLAKLEMSGSQEEREIIEQALKIGLNALADGEVKLDDY
ncbi:MAG: DNA repair exonuclease [Clostridium sp.]|nr:DNA repair exonuclease [Clostridium sp.]